MILTSASNGGERFKLAARDRLTFVRALADSSLSKSFLAAGAVVSIRTNAEPLLRAAEETFLPLPSTPAAPGFALHLWVDESVRSDPPWPRPYFGGLRHLVFVGLDRSSSLLIDLDGRMVVGRVSPQIARDVNYWKRTIFPIVLGIVAPCMGVAALHCACVVRKGQGLLLTGDSGAGKSTLAVALARSGFDFLSDDWTYFSRWRDRWRAWGVPTTAKLLPEAVAFFPELASTRLSVALNGETAYEFAPDEMFGVGRSLQCEPRWMMFLERDATAPLSLTRVSTMSAAARLDGNLRPSRPESLEPRRSAVEALSRCECFQLRYSESPAKVAEALSRYVRMELATYAG